MKIFMGHLMDKSGWISMNAIDLYASCGGFSRGFMDAGFYIIVGVDYEHVASSTFIRNHDGA